MSDDSYPLDGEITELRVRREMMRRPTLSVDQVSALTGIDLQALKEAESGIAPLYREEQNTVAAFLGTTVPALFNRAGYSHQIVRRASKL